MTYPIDDLFTKLQWLRTRSVPLSENNLNQFINTLQSLGGYNDLLTKLTGVTQDNELFYYQQFTDAANDQAIVNALEDIFPDNNVRDAIEFCTSGRAQQLTGFCITKIFQILGSYPEFSSYAASLQDITPETTQDYIRQLNAILLLPQFVFDASRILIPNEE